MKKLLAIASLIISTSSFATTNQCLDEAKLQLTANINQQVTNVVRLEGAETLAPGEESFMLGEEIWNSSKSPVEIYVFRMNTSGIAHRMQVKMTLPRCRVLAILDHGRPL